MHEIRFLLSSYTYSLNYIDSVSNQSNTGMAGFSKEAVSLISEALLPDSAILVQSCVGFDHKELITATGIFEKEGSDDLDKKLNGNLN